MKTLFICVGILAFSYIGQIFLTATAWAAFTGDNYDSGGTKAAFVSQGCVAHSYPSASAEVYQGGGSFKTWTTNAYGTTCPDSNRSYPDYKIAEYIPALVTFRIKIDPPDEAKTDAAAYAAIGGNRFSPLTVKENPAGGTLCNTVMFTTQTERDGSMGELGHSITTFRATASNVKLPLRQWFQYSAYLENRSDGKTHVTVWVNDRVAVEGTTGNPFQYQGKGIITELHMGLYGQNNNIKALYNDEVKLFSNLSGINDAARLIGQQLSRGPVEILGHGASSLGTPDACRDGKDNDGDGAIDFPADLQCDCPLDSSEGTNPPPECADGIDNDNDGKIDHGSLNQKNPDYGCSGRNNDSEKEDPIPTNYPTLSFTANPTDITSGGSSTLKWSSTNATSCTASGGWSGSKGTSGSQSTGSLTKTTDYILACTGPGGYRARLATANVGSGLCVSGGQCTINNCPGTLVCQNNQRVCQENSGCTPGGNGPSVVPVSDGNGPPAAPVLNYNGPG